VSEWTVRAPAALFALATVALCTAFVAARLGRARGVLAGLILIGAYPFVDQGRYGRVDMVLAFCEALSLLSFVRWSEAGHDDRRWHYLLAVALGLGVLAKGPVGALLPAAAIALFLLRDGRARVLRALCAPGPIVVFLLVASSWYVACALSRDWPALDRQLGSENFGRFFGTLGRMPLTYYVAPFLLSAVPFSVLAPLVVARALGWGEGATRTSDGARAAAGWAPLLAIFATLTFAFFSVAAYKRRAYLLPMWPALSALVPWWLGTIADRKRRAEVAGALAVAAVVLVCVNGAYVPYKERRDCPAGVLRALAARINQAVPARQPIYLQGVSVDDAAPLLFYLDRTGPIVSTPGVASPAIVFAESWAGNPTKTRILASVGAGWKRLLVVESSDPLKLGLEEHVRTD
jgi:4-amino-4-deoxy-L-arabinose transferase-like glycosyltransferase